MGDVESLVQELVEERFERVCRLFTSVGARAPVVVWRPTRSDIRSPTLLRFQERFEALRAGRSLVPLATVRPEAYGALREYLLVLDADAGGSDFRYRYFGRQLARHFGGDFTGTLASQLGDPMGLFVRATYRAVQVRQEPLYTEHEPVLGVLPITSQRVIQPLGLNDRVEGMLVACDPEDPLLRIADIVPDAVLVLDAVGRIRVMNPAAETLFGGQGDRIPGLPASELLGLDFLSRVLGGWPPPPLVQNVVAQETDARGATGETLALEVSIGELMGRGSRVLVAVIRDVTARRREETAIRRLAFADPLTGIANRLIFEERLQRALAAAGRSRRKVALLLFDLDRFKEVNDTLGHRQGDLVLKAFADQLSSEIRETDTIARIGGDEFVLIQTDLETAGDALVLAERLLGRLARPLEVDGQAVTLRASVGIALFPDHAGAAEALLEAADRALYEAKRQGGGAAALHPEAPPRD